MHNGKLLLVFEFATGLFGWIWIGATVAAIYYAGKALFFGGGWTAVLWAIGIGVVAKWLTRGFLENKNRVIFEDELINRGLTPDEASRTWVDQQNGDTTPSSGQQEAVTIIQAYGAVMESCAPSPGTVADESSLPYPKAKIKNALIVGLRSTDNEQMTDHLKTGYIQLADWQPGVGDKDSGIDISKIDSQSDLESIAKNITAQSEAFEHWLPVVQKEQEQLKNELVQLGLW